MAAGQDIELTHRVDDELVIHLIDLQGQLISRVTTSDSNIDISTAGLVPGQYLLHLSSSEFAYSEKITLH